MFTERNKPDVEEKSHDTELLKAVLTLLKRQTRSENWFLYGAPSQDFIQADDDIEIPQTTSALILLRYKIIMLNFQPSCQIRESFCRLSVYFLEPVQTVFLHSC